MKIDISFIRLSLVMILLFEIKKYNEVDVTECSKEETNKFIRSDLTKTQ
ncbi:hypothetical protein PHOSAC3_120667 [Mesotoga infera]|nr:hypothetical protein PHOSAC3_120667 [Mesotoga infera]